jgi:hypothetical protein
MTPHILAAQILYVQLAQKYELYFVYKRRPYAHVTSSVKVWWMVSGKVFKQSKGGFESYTNKFKKITILKCNNSILAEE